MPATKTLDAHDHVAEITRRKLIEGLAPTRFATSRTAAPATPAFSPEGETRFRIEIVSASFEGLSRIEPPRLLHRVLAAELAGRVQALSRATLTPQEAGAEMALARGAYVRRSPEADLAPDGSRARNEVKEHKAEANWIAVRAI